MLLDYYNSEDCNLEPSDAPFRDEPDGADAVESVGTGTPWYEDVADWIVAAYLAFTFTPAAGIFYITTLRNIRLQFRARNFGAIGQIFLDDVLQVDVDTYSPTDELIDIFIRGAAPEGFAALDVETHEIRIVHTGTHNSEATAAPEGYALEVIRDYIGIDQGQRFYISATDSFEYLSGDDWLPLDPEADPRHINRVPPRDGTQPRCDAAENLVENLHTYVDENIAAMTLGASVAALTSLAFTRIPFLSPLLAIGIVEGVVAAILTAGASTLTTVFTEEVYDDLKQLFYCHMDENGRLTAESLAAVEADIFDTMSGTVYTIMRVLFATSGEAGFNEWAAMGTLEGDCDEYSCNWCYIWSGPEIASSGNWGIIESGQIYNAAASFASVLTLVEFGYEGSIGSGSGGNGVQLWLNDSAGGDPIMQQLPVPESPGVLQWIPEEPYVNTSGLYLGVNWGGGGAGVITYIKLAGIGEQPEGFNDGTTCTP